MISRRMTMGGSLFAFAALTVSCSDLPSTEQEEQKQIEETTSQPPMMKLTEASENNMKNIITENYQGPFGGVPQFDKVALEDFEPGVKAAIAEGLAEIDAIAENEAPATFENTIVALERQGKALSRASTYYYLWSNNLSSPEFQEIESKIDPLYAEYRSQIIQNEKLFKRIETVWNDKDALNELGEEEQRLTWDYYTDYVRAGAALSTETKERIGDINEDLSKLYTQFSQNLLHDEESYVTWLKEEQLSGLPENLKEAAASAATERGRSGEYAILNTRSSMEPFLTYADDRALREQVWRTYYNRGDNGDETDNNAIISDILRLRNERSRLQGYDNFAARAIEKQVAKTPAQAMDLMQRVWPAAIARVEEEVADMQAVADREGANITIAPWDYRYYAEKVRQETYDLDTNEVKQYLQLSHLVDGMFWMAKELYDFNFQDVTDQVPVFHEDVRVWEVTREGDHQGLFYFDPYARPGKRSGAWMTSYRTQDKLDGATPVIVSNNSNFIKGAEGEPTLISWDDATTLLHEFGHAVHGLLSDVTYPSLSGTAVPRDYVEFPSQVHENWLMTSEFLSQFALHHETGDPIPEALVKKIKKAETFNQGFATTEYLASAFVDMRLHTLADASDVDIDAIEREILEDIGMPDELPMRHRTPQFAHVFSGEGYAAGYYSYLWADTFAADAWEAFEEAKNPLDPETGQKFIDHILSVGNTIDPSEGYASFRGRPVDVNALMRERGFPVE